MAHDSTTQLVLQTIDAYERSARKCVARWNKRRHRRPPLLVEWLQCLPVDARLLDLGCGGGKDAGDLGQRGYRVVGLDRTSALLSAGRRRIVHDGSARLRDPLFRRCRRGLGCRLAEPYSKPDERRILTTVQVVRPAPVAATVTMREEPPLTVDGSGRYFARWRKDEPRAGRRAG